MRLLGLGHLICWIPLVGYFAILLAHGTENGLYRWWLVSVITINVASLAIDAIDVGRYVLGEREPMTQELAPGATYVPGAFLTRSLLFGTRAGGAP